jgi:hypothetical protein
MNREERKQIGHVIVLTAQYYDRKLTPEVISMMVDDLADLDAAAVAEAFREYRRNPANRFFPLPGQIRAIVAPGFDDNSAARDAAGRILSAVSRFGWNNPERAKEYVGTLGWAVVERQGGWRNVCETLTFENSGQLQAQWRDLALAISNRAKAGGADLPPAIPDKRDTGNLKLISEMVARVTERKTGDD